VDEHRDLVRLSTPSLAKMCDRRAFTVATVIDSAAPMSALVPAGRHRKDHLALP
jgi:hypothetical protein